MSKMSGGKRVGGPLTTQRESVAHECQDKTEWEARAGLRTHGEIMAQTLRNTSKRAATCKPHAQENWRTPSVDGSADRL